MNIDQTIIKRAIETWGHEKQLKMVREECLELALAIGKFQERNEAIDPELTMALQKEIADVNIMIQQANIMFGHDHIQEFVDQKLARLNDRLNKKEF